MLVAILLSVIAVEAILVIKWRITTAVLIYYMELKKYTQPDKKELEVCTEWVIRQLFKV